MSDTGPDAADQGDPYPRRRMARRRSPARWLAPLALLICAFAMYSVVNATLLKKDDDKSSKPQTTQTGTTTTTSTTAGKKAAAKTPKSYTVRSGDVLSAIAQKTGVPVDEIQKLNPSVDARSLRPGQKLKLRE